MTPFAKSISGRGWTQNMATGCYAVAASSGSIFFSLNFGDEGKHNPLLLTFKTDRV
jgi:alpha-1,3-glucan synthase